MQADGYEAEGVDISREQAALARAAGVARVRQGDFRAILAAHPAHYAAITATDLVGDASKARKKLGWQPTVGFRQLIEMMVDADLENEKRNHGPSREVTTTTRAV